jgi:autotransporter strand-loop-strand O-heptosyltransferase
MHTNNKVKVDISNNLIIIENKTLECLENCYINVFTIFYSPLLNHTFNLNPKEKITISLNDYHFKKNWENETLYVKLYHDHILIYEKQFKDKTKCFVLLSNKTYEKLTEQLIAGLTQYSTVDIFHYTINYKSKLKYDNLTNIEFKLEGDVNDPQYMQFAKPPVFIDILEKGYINAVFLDSDIQVRSNINCVFDYIKELEEGPIFHKSYWDYTIANGIYIPGPLLQNYLDLPPQPWAQGVTNVVVFNKKHLELFKEWKSICFLEEINNIRKKEFLHDELILNCLMWKKNIKPKLFYFVLNVIDEKDVDFFYNYNNLSYNNDVDLNDYEKGHPFQSHFPYDKSQVIGFHCVKDYVVAEKINDLIYKKEIIRKNMLYDNLIKNENIFQEIEPFFNINFINGPYLEIKNSPGKKYKVSFINKQNNKTEHSGEIDNDCWIKANKSYYVDWKITAYDGENTYEYDLDLEDQRVYIALDSKSLGDNLAWFPYVEEFRKKHKCHLICSTFWNNLFKPQYPEIEFVSPGEVVSNILAQYTIGWFYNNDNTYNLYKNPNDFKLQPLQKTASDILGLEYKEIIPEIKLFDNIERENIITIAIHSTAQSKYWNNPTGWQQLVDYLKNKGYRIILLSREENGYMGNFHPKGIEKHPEGPIEDVIKLLQKSKMFIGVGSGLSWLSWTTKTPTTVISGFSYSYTETKINTIRIDSPINKCKGCFNTHRLDPSDWNWCPIYKGTPQQFECSKSITAEQVIKAIEHMI